MRSLINRDLRILILLGISFVVFSCTTSQIPSISKMAKISYAPLVEKKENLLPDHLPSVSYNDFLSNDTLNIIFYGINHPFFPVDNIGMKTFGYNLSHLSENFDIAFSFNTGQQLKNTLVDLTELGYTIGNICIAGHSGYYGFFVEDGAGFYVDHYVYRKKGTIKPFAEGVLFIRDLKESIANNEISLASNGLWVLAGCNTSSHNPSFADMLTKASGRATISANQKVDLFNVPKVGLYLRGTEGGTFLVHQLNLQTKKIEKLDLETENINIDDAIKAYQYYKASISQ